MPFHNQIPHSWCNPGVGKQRDMVCDTYCYKKWTILLNVTFLRKPYWFMIFACFFFHVSFFAGDRQAGDRAPALRYHCRNVISCSVALPLCGQHIGGARRPRATILSISALQENPHIHGVYPNSSHIYGSNRLSSWNAFDISLSAPLLHPVPDRRF